MSELEYSPQRFYLLSKRKRLHFEYKSDDQSLEKAVEDAFAHLPRKEGGNVYSLFSFSKPMLEVMIDLSNRFKSQYPSIQKLPAYFRQLRENDLFIRHKDNVSICDLKRSLIKIKAIEDSRNQEVEDLKFALNWGKLFLTYDTHSFGFLTNKEFVGESDPSRRVCRFCGKSGERYFKNRAHSIMEALGNKLLFCNEECDECNLAFEKSIEWHLYKFLEIDRTLSMVSGKGSKNHHLEGLNFHIHPDSISHKPVVYVKQDVVINDLYKDTLTGKILLVNKGEISFNGVYKSLVKIAIDMIPPERISWFAETCRWLHGDIEGKDLPMFYYGEHNVFFEQPVLDLFFKTGLSPSISPYCTSILYIFDAIFIYVIPMCSLDNRELDFKAHWEFFKKHQYLDIAEWEEFNPNNKDLLNPYYKIPLISNKYRLEFRPRTDEVFNTNH